MKNRLMSLRSALVLPLAVLCLTGTCNAQLRIVTYNTALACRSGMSDVLKGIGDETRAGIRRPIDVISLQEQDLSLTVTQQVADTLNALYPPGTYARATLAGAGDSTQSIVYNTATVQLIAQARVGSTSGSGAPRQPMRFRLRPVGYTAAADFYLYSNHYKAGDSDAARRNVEAQMVRADADALGIGVRVIYTGDFNIYGANESMWTTLTAVGNGEGFDPLNRPGTPFWNSAAFSDILTQSPVVSADQNYAGQTGGGLDDRFDWQMVTAPVLSGHGFSWISGTYRAFGNTGHAFNTNASSGGGQTLLPFFSGYTLAQMNNVLHQIEMVSDHLPVVADYRIPAQMAVTAGTGTQVVIVGTPAAVHVAVANTAPVTLSAGADTLDFQVHATGTLGSVVWSGTASAASAAVETDLAVDTSAAGLKTGIIVATTTSPGVPTPSFTSGQTQVLVLEHAAPSFLADSQTSTTAVDFGTVTRGSGPQHRAVRVYNGSNSSSPFTAGLDLTQITAQPSSDAITTDLTPFQNLAVGSSVPFAVTVDTDTSGVYHTTYQLLVADHGVLGGTSSSMTLDVTVTVAGVPGDFTGDGAVDGADLDYVLSGWGVTTDANDLDLVLANWGAH